jgi:predicted transcriptional regulator
MEQYIKKSALVAEIEKEIKRVYAGREYVGIPLDEENRVYGLQMAKDIIDTLEVKEVDLEKECSKYFEDNDLCVHDDCIKFAKHFFELGLNSRHES